MEKIDLVEMVEMAGKATPRQFLSNFKKLSGIVNDQTGKEVNNDKV